MVTVFIFLVLLVVTQMCITSSIKLPSSSLLRLKSINDLAISRGICTGTILSDKGDEAIKIGLQQVQRLQLQLDRSDGRPASITVGSIANKYSMLISSCLRPVIEDDENAWLAALGPLEYVGFRIHDFIKEEEDVYIVDYSLMVTKMKRILLDISSNEEDPMHNKKDDKSAEDIKDLSINLARIVLRYAFYIEKLHSKPSLGITIVCDEKLLSTEIMETILSLDFYIPYTIYTSSSLLIDIKLHDIEQWKSRTTEERNSA